MLRVISFLRAHWRPVAVVVLVAGAFVGGRFTAPKPAVTKHEQVAVKEHEQVKTTETQTVQAQTQTAEVKTVVVYRDRIVQPDGTRHEREIEASVTDKRAMANLVAQAQKVETREVVREVEKRVEVKVETPAPSWRIGAMAGFSVAQAQLLPPDPGPLGFGAIVERRIVGPVSVGAWGLSSGQGGLLVTVEF